MKQFTPVNCHLKWSIISRNNSWFLLAFLLSFFTVESWGNEHDYYLYSALDKYSNSTDSLTCKDTTVIVITDGDCSMVEVDMILENGPSGSNDNLIFDIDLYDGDQVCCDAVDLVLNVIVEDTITGDYCTGKIYTTDAVAPSCESVTDYTILCSESLPSVDDSSHFGYPQFSDNCSIDNVILTSQVNSGDICDDGVTITRVWTAIDNQGNSSSSDCVQVILVEREQPIFPVSVNFACSQYTTGDMTPDITGWPTGIEVGCFFWTSYSDVLFLGCDDSEIIHRTWTILDMCTNAVFTDTQFIDLSDSDGPSIDAVPMTLSANIDQCFFTGFIEAPVILEECSGLESVEMFIEGVTEVSYEYDDLGIIIGLNVDGNGIEVGTHTLSIIATDECGNTSTKEVDLTIVDNIAPTMVCLENPSIALTEVNGSAQAIINVEDIVLEAIDCSDDLTFSFSEDMSLTELAFDCQDLGNVEIVAWVTDESNLTGNCNVTLTVEDPDNLCDFTSANELKVSNSTVLYQNAPNPVSGSTTIGFELPEASTVQLTIVDINGVVVEQISGAFGEGYNSVFIERIDRRGVLFYTLETNNFTATRKMVIKD